MTLGRLLVASSALLTCLAQTPQSERDLRFHKEGTAEPKTPGAVVVPRGYALVIGVSRYKNLSEASQLKFADRDAAEIYATLISPEGGRFPPENVHKLIGPQASLVNIHKELETWLPSVSSEQDRVLIYFAGHGFLSSGKAYLAPYDIDPSDIPNTSYPMSTLGEVFGGRIKAKWRVLLTDACHSGAILPASDAQAVNENLQRINPDVFSLTASKDRERSYEGPMWRGGHGVFTYYVIKGMEGEADSSGDGVVTADELAEYVHINVRRDTKQLQNPTSERGSFDPKMVLAYNPSRARIGPLEQPKFGRLVIETNMDGVEVFVDDKSQGIVNKGTPRMLPGLTLGAHTVKGVHMGYEPDGPREEMVYPGQDTTVTLRILIVRRKNKAAVDLFEKGLEFYTKGGQRNYTNAVEDFQKALRIDPAYSQAARYLGSTYNALFDEQKADQYFRKAIEIDPDYSDARATYGGVLLDRGDFDGAIRQLTGVVQREPAQAQAHYMLAVAFARKGGYDESIREGREAVRLTPGNGEAHFWLGEGLRMSGHCAEAEPEYNSYLRLSDFDSKLAGKMNYYVLGYLIGMGKKKRASQHDIWMDLRNQANFGLCDCELISKQFDKAITYCQTALVYDAQDPFAHYVLARSYSEKYNASSNVGLLAAARKHFAAVVDFNSETEEAGKAKKYIENIDRVIQRIH